MAFLETANPPLLAESLSPRASLMSPTLSCNNGVLLDPSEVTLQALLAVGTLEV